MSESSEQVRKHIGVLSEFERKYGEYLSALAADHAEATMPSGMSYEGEYEYGGVDWSSQEWSRRKREISMLAVRADLAMKASGVGQLYITHPPAMGGGVKSTDLPSQVFDFDPGFADDGMDIQRAILERIPAQIAGLEIKLEEAEANEARSKPKLKAKWRPPPQKQKRRWPTLVGRVRHVPPFIGFIADAGGFVVVVAFIGRLIGVW